MVQLGVLLSLVGLALAGDSVKVDISNAETDLGHVKVPVRSASRLSPIWMGCRARVWKTRSR